VVELKVSAISVGVIVKPNAAKHACLSRRLELGRRLLTISFTTVSHLGIVHADADRQFVIGGYSGLIEEHIARGTGHEFLGHIERAASSFPLVEPLANPRKRTRSTLSGDSRSELAHTMRCWPRAGIVVVSKRACRARRN